MTTLLWTKNSSILSKLIRWVFNEPVSHFAILLDNKIVFNHNLLGAQIYFWNNFQKKQTIVYRAPLYLSPYEEEAIYWRIVETNANEGYNYKAFLYFAWCALKFKFFKTEIPSRNPWSEEGSDLCTQDAKCLPSRIFNSNPTDLSITTPFTLYKMIKPEATSSPKVID